MLHHSIQNHTFYIAKLPRGTYLEQVKENDRMQVDFFTDPIGFIQYHLSQTSPYVFLAIQLVVILFLYFLVTQGVKRSLEAAGMGPEAATGIGIVLRLLFFISFLFVIIGFLGPDFSTILSLTAVFGTALGLAFSQAVGNIVSGLYVLVARPFRVGDYVRVGTIEGVVREITLNYTRILRPDLTRQIIPNGKIVTSEITNYRVEISEFIDEEESEGGKKSERSVRGSLLGVYERLKNAAGYDKAYRYTFDLTFHQNLDHNKIHEVFDTACKKWARIFIRKPRYSIWAAPSAAVMYRFSFIVLDPMDIIRHSSNFKKDLMQIHWISS